MPIRTLLAAFLIATLVSIQSIHAVESQFGIAPQNSQLVVDETFDEPLDKKWHVNTGTWKVVDGVLQASEVAADNHAAAARRTVQTDNAVYQLRFKISDGTKAFHFGFDPAKGELDKKGHLFSVIVTPTGWRIMKHVDKNRRQEDPNEVLASSDVAVQTGKWHELRVTTWQNYVTATIDQTELKASHPTFGVKKPTLVFRCAGEGVEIDDVKVWSQRR
ncbi:hypothetical protein Mal15_46370 [Stieleria maiorica]|uniref:3-keto-disaccharide hydrolase domain-containing protein n=1 Tax=Stieleria maiorica TaxID=2795974 RepID=A0A5B9MM29_9BACT|nr:hypothetical protein [Stieleria maiorica]QEG00566.1 hypothetical protein Mal15_46370 [Stieleria maiorica]